MLKIIIVLNYYSCCFFFLIVCTTHLQMLAMLLALPTRQLIKASCRIFLEAFKVQYCRFTKYNFIDFSSKPSSILILSGDLERIQKRAMRVILPRYKYLEALKGVPTIVIAHICSAHLEILRFSYR